jgi:acetyl esterase/lipase
MVAMTPRSAKLGPPAKVAAVVNFYGITDVADQLEGPHFQKYAVTWVPEQEGRRELAKRVSPITYVRKDLPPILTLHGDADKTVPYEHGANLTRELKNAGADARLITVPGAGHGFPQATLDDQSSTSSLSSKRRKCSITKEPLTIDHECIRRAS